MCFNKRIAKTGRKRGKSELKKGKKLADGEFGDSIEIEKSRTDLVFYLFIHLSLVGLKESEGSDWLIVFHPVLLVRMEDRPKCPKIFLVELDQLSSYSLGV
jgi:hypothetical protein